MADVGAILSKVRALGADVLLDRGTMTIVGSVHLNDEQRTWLASNRDAIEAHLLSTSGSGFDAHAPHRWGDFARILYGECPESVDPFDWSWFVMTAGKIVRGEGQGSSSEPQHHDGAETLQ